MARYTFNNFLELCTMAIQNAHSLFKNISTFLYANSKQIAMTLTFIVLLVGLFFAHKLWVINRERSAQYDFAALMIEFENVSREKDPQWSALLEKFEAQYQKHASSSLLPYYLSYKVQILLAEDKKDEALLALDTMITHLSGSPLIALYEMERALIQLDIDDAKLNEIGLSTLQTLANDKDNTYRDSAQYYLGRYYWAQNQIADARAVWQQLVDEQRDEKMSPSPWVDQVQQQLELT
jgi:predicted negative regulator of RcsB-dependent stress response